MLKKMENNFNKHDASDAGVEICMSNSSDIHESLYTLDEFACSLCEFSATDIDEYVLHMTKHEECFLVIKKSSYVNDLMLPRFRKKQKLHNDENVKFLIKDQDASLENSPIVRLIETDQGQKWKCRACCITFARQAAILNHLKLQHPVKVESIDVKPNPISDGTSFENGAAENMNNEIEKVDSKENLRLVSNDKDSKSEFSNTACHICGQICKTAIILTRHLRIVHSHDRPFLCTMDSCTMDFKTKGSLVRHQRRHTDSRPYKCSKCERSFRESGSLLRHQMASICCNVKSSQNSFARHGSTMPFKQWKIEEKGDWPLPLKMEDSNLPSININREEEEHTPEESKAAVWQQIIAAKTLEATRSPPKVATNLIDRKPPINLSGLKKESINASDDHGESQESAVSLPEDLSKMISKFEDSEKSDMKPPVELQDDISKIIQTSYCCPVCSKSYKTEHFLIRHLKSHKDELGPSMECPTCRKCFTCLSSLCRHLISHSNLRQFECTLCRKSFKLKGHALVHLKAHSEEKKFSCLECTRRFKTASARNFHQRTHSGLVQFECNVCYKSFTTKSSFQRHTRVHSGNRPFQCPYCQMGFKEHGTLNRHINYRAPCSQKHRGLIPPTSKIEIQKNLKSLKQEEEVKNDKENGNENDLSVNNDLMSEPDSDFESYMSEFDLSSIYSDHSQMSFDPDECFLPLLESVVLSEQPDKLP